MGELEVAEQQQVDVDWARAVAYAAGLAPEVALQALEEIEQGERLERCLDAQAGIQEGRLVEDLANGIGVVHRGGAQHAHAGARQRVDGGLQMAATVADVGAEAEQAYSAISRQTSTETSSTGSGIGGSGLVALTHMPSSWKSASRRSAIAEQRRSSVR